MRSFQFKKNEHMVESRSFYNMLHVHVSLNQCHSLCKKTCMSMDIFQVQVVGEVGQETLFPKFCTHPPLFPKIFFLYAQVRVFGVQWRKFAKQSALFFWNGMLIFGYFKEGIQKDTWEVNDSPTFHSDG